MSEKETVRILQRYKKAKSTSVLHANYLCSFESKMIYRTTKMENVEATHAMVEQVLKKQR